MFVFIELVLLPILAGTLANVLSEWLIRFVASNATRKRNSLSALSKHKKTPLAATGGVFLCAYFIELLSKSIVPLKRVSVKNIVIVLFLFSASSLTLRQFLIQ